MSIINAGKPVQSDWSESDTSDPSYIQNKPTIPSGSSLVPSTTGVTSGYVLTNSNGTPTWLAGGGNDNADIEIRIKPIVLTTPFSVTPESGTTTNRYIVSRYHKFIANDSNDNDNYFICNGRTTLTANVTGTSTHRCATNISSSGSIDEILSAITINKPYNGRLNILAIDSADTISITQTNFTTLVVTNGVITKPSSIHYESVSGTTTARTISQLQLVIGGIYTV